MPRSITCALTFVIALTLLPASSGSSLAQSNPTLDCTPHHGVSSCSMRLVSPSPNNAQLHTAS
jgi:hypothetical protein